jgi:hypothetical protein
MSMFDLHVVDSAPTPYDDVGDHQVKSISTNSGGLLGSIEARVRCVPFLHENRTIAIATIGSRLRRITIS